MSDKQYTLKLEELPEFIFGADGEGDSTDTSTKSGEDSNAQQKQEPAGSDPADEEHEEEDDDDKDTDTKGLKSALAKERAAAKAEKKRADALQRDKDDRDLATKSEIDQAKIKEQKATAKLEKLTAGFQRSALDNAIRAAAKDFVDPEDAVAGVDRSQLVFEQDKEDPSDVTIDAKSVERAVKALAAKKAHYLKTGTTDSEATGGQFGGSKRKQGTPDQVYKERYPSLS